MSFLGFPLFPFFSLSRLLLSSHSLLYSSLLLSLLRSSLPLLLHFFLLVVLHLLQAPLLFPLPNLSAFLCHRLASSPPLLLPPTAGPHHPPPGPPPAPPSPPITITSRHPPVSGAHEAGDEEKRTATKESQDIGAAGYTHRLAARARSSDRPRSQRYTSSSYFIPVPSSSSSSCLDRTPRSFTLPAPAPFPPCPSSRRPGPRRPLSPPGPLPARPDATAITTGTAVVYTRNTDTSPPPPRALITNTALATTTTTILPLPPPTSSWRPPFLPFSLFPLLLRLFLLHSFRPRHATPATLMCP